MKAFRILFICLLMGILFTSCEKSESINADFYACELPFTDPGLPHPKAAALQHFLDSLTSHGVPGLLLSVHMPDGSVWTGASGKADIANGVNMQPCTISRAGSVVKTFTAVTVLMLAEEGKIDLDSSITHYLPPSVTDKLDNANQATVRQLLQHSSGIYNYIQNLHFQTASLNDLVKVWQPNELLTYAHHKKAAFKPGADVSYSNTNYILLGMLIEKVTGKHFSFVFKERIFEPLGLTKTSFDIERPIPLGLARGYVDLYGDLNIIESTRYSGWDYYTADGGLISNPYDLSIFIKALFAGKLLKPETLVQMQAWKQPKESDGDYFPMEYGLGIFRIQTPYGYGLIHSGDAIGYYGCMIYFPEKQVTISWQSNGNYGKIDDLISTKEAMLRIFRQVF